MTVPVRPAQDVRLRPLPWRRMAWVTWRHHRIALGGAVLLLGALALWLWISGLQLHHAYATALACHPATSAACSNLINAFGSTNVLLKGGFALQPVPALIGAFIGAPMLAREIETGTFRYAWTQGFGRWRWALAKLVAVGVAVAVMAEAFSLLVSWYYQPYLATGQVRAALASASPLSPGLFDLRGVAFAAWTLAAFAIGALAGMLIRRVVPAIVATLAVYSGLALVTANVLRRQYLTALVTSKNLGPAAWITSQWWTKGGKVAFRGQAPLSLLQRLCPSSFFTGPGGRVGIRTVGPGGGVEVREGGSQTSCLLQHGYTQWSSYQPASHFWALQWIEGGWLLALSAVLIAVTVWLVRHRVA